MAKAAAPKSISLQEALALLQQGGIDSLPKGIQIPLDDLRQEDIVALLEIARLKSFGPGYDARLDRLLGPSTGGKVGELQLMQSLVECGNYDKVLNRFSERPGSQDDPDLMIQKIRAQIFVGDFKAGLAATGSLLKSEALQLNSRGVVHQLMSHCLIELGDFQSALDCLGLAFDIASAVGNRHGKLACELFRVKAHCLIDELGEAETHFNEALKYVAPSDENFRWLIGLYRTWSFLLYCQGDPSFLDRSAAAAALAASIGDSLYELRTWIESFLMVRAMGATLGTDLSDELRARVAKAGIEKQGDVPVWLDALDCKSHQRAANWPMSLRFLVRKSAHALESAALEKLMARLKEGVTPEAPTPSWMLDRERGWLLDLNKKTHRAFADQSPALRLVELLSNEQKGLSLEAAFERAWELRWNEAVHANTISVAISRLNVKQPSYGIARKRGVLEISRAGLVI